MENALGGGQGGSDNESCDKPAQRLVFLENSQIVRNFKMVDESLIIEIPDESGPGSTNSAFPHNSSYTLRSHTMQVRYGMIADYYPVTLSFGQPDIRSLMIGCGGFDYDIQTISSFCFFFFIKKKKKKIIRKA